MWKRNTQISGQINPVLELMGRPALRIMNLRGQSEVHDEEDGAEPEEGDGGPDVGEDGAQNEGVGADDVHHAGVPCRLQVPKHDVAYPANSDLPVGVL